MKKLFFLLILLNFSLYPAVYEKYLKKGDPLDDKILNLLNLIKENPNVSQYHNNLGILLLEKKFPKDAKREFKKAIKLDKKNFNAWYNLGILYEAEGQKFLAFRCFKKTVKYKRGHDLAHYHVGMFWESIGFKNKAIKHYLKALSINQEILNPAYNPPIVFNKLLYHIFTAYYKKYKVASMQKYEMQTLPEIKKEEPIKAPELEKMEEKLKAKEEEIKGP